MSSEAAHPDYRFRTIQIPNRDLDLQVYALVQDDFGFVWIGTRDGLFRYDGAEFRPFLHDPEDPDSIRQNWVWDLKLDKDGHVWILTWGGGVSRFDTRTETMTHFSHDPGNRKSLSSNNVWTMLQQQDGTIWVGTEEGLDRFDGEDEGFTRFSSRPGEKGNLSGDSISAIAEDAQGRLWLGVYGGGVDVFSPESGKVRHFPELENVWDLMIDREDRVWAASESGLWQKSRESDTFVRFDAQGDWLRPLAGNHLTYLVEDTQGNLVISSWGEGLFVLNADRHELTNYKHDLTNSASISDNTVNRTMFDRDGALWLATDTSLSKADPLEHRFTSTSIFATGAGWISTPAVEAILENDLGQLWVGTDGAGLFLTSSEGEVLKAYSLEHQSGLVDNVVTSIKPGLENKLWLGTRGGLQSLDPGSGSFQTFIDGADPSRAPIGSNIADLALDPSGNLWIACYGSGVSRLDQLSGTFTHFSREPVEALRKGLATDWVTVVEVGQSGDIWVGGDGGLSKIDPSTGEIKTIATMVNSQSGLNVVSLYEDRGGVLWIGTDIGLYKLTSSEKTLVPVSDESFNSGQRIQSIVSDAQGYIWISTNKGVSRIEPETNTYWNFTRADGLQSDSYRPLAELKTSKGEILFGGYRGFDRFDPASIVRSNKLAPVVFTRLAVDGEVQMPMTSRILNETISGTNTITLSSDQASFSISFAALNFSVSEKNRFRHKLSGFDAGWIDSGSDHTVQYMNIDPGEYVLQVVAANHDGVWNEKPVELLIVVSRAWWQQPFLPVFALVLLVSSLMAATKFGGKYQAARAARFEALVKERTRELEEEMQGRLRAEKNLLKEKMENAARGKQKMEALGQLAGGVAHDFNNLLGIIGGNLDFLERHGSAKAGLQKRIEGVKRAISRGSELTHKLLGFASRQTGQVSTIDLRKTLEEMEAVLQQAVTSAVQVSLQVSEEPCFASVDQGELENVVLNLALNARDAMPDGGALSIQVHPVEAQLESSDDKGPDPDPGACVEIVVSDTGTGMSAETLSRAFEPFFTTKPSGAGTGLGLSTVFGFVTRAGGHVNVESEPGMGTTFKMLIPSDARPDPTTQDTAERHRPIRNRILVVDDEAELCELLRDWLCEAGYEVETASSAETALEVLAGTDLSFDLVITDLVLPGSVNGFGLSAEAERLYPEMNVLFTTGNSDLSPYKHGSTRSHWTIVHKPYEKKLILTLVQRALSR